MLIVSQTIARTGAWSTIAFGAYRTISSSAHKYASQSGHPLDITRSVMNVSNVSGTGPFAAQPKFSVHGSLLHVALPSGASIKTRQGSVVAMSSNDGLNLNSELDIKDRSLAELAKVSPLAFQSISSDVSTSVVMETSLGDLNDMSVLEFVSHSDTWTVCNRDHIVAWTGDLVPAPVTNTPSHIEFSGNNGQLAVAGRGNITLVELAPNEQMCISEPHLVAYQGPVSALKPVSTALSLDLQQRSSTIHLDGKNSPLTRLRSWWATTTDNTQRLLARSLSKPSTNRVRIEGPLRVLLQTSPL